MTRNQTLGYFLIIVMRISDLYSILLVTSTSFRSLFILQIKKITILPLTHLNLHLIMRELNSVDL